MHRPSASDALFWVLALLSAVALGVLVLVLAGAISVESTPEPAAAPETLDAPPGTTALSRTAAEPAPTSSRAATTGSAPAPTPPPADELAVVVVTATRGDSWVSARQGSESGPVLEERLLAQGESIRLEGERVWLSLGAAGNVDLTVDGKPRSLGSGTVSGVLTPTGVEASPS